MDNTNSTIHISYRHALIQLAFIVVRTSYRHNPDMMNNTQKYEDAIASNMGILGDVLYNLFPNLFSESEFLKEIKRAERIGICVHIIRSEPDEQTSLTFSQPK
jgi:hypothetical protein